MYQPVNKKGEISCSPITNRQLTTSVIGIKSCTNVIFFLRDENEDGGLALKRQTGINVMSIVGQKERDLIPFVISFLTKITSTWKHHSTVKQLNHHQHCYKGGLQ